MAVLDAVPGLKVQVFVNGLPLLEYEDDEDVEQNRERDDVVTKYVEATSGANFEIRYTLGTDIWTVDSPGHDVQSSLVMDGKRVEKICYSYSPHRASAISKLSGVLSYRHGQWTIQRFRFSALNIDETSTTRLDRETMEALKYAGQMTVTFHAIKKSKIVKMPTKERTLEFSNLGTLSEKMLKGQALSHATLLDPPKLCEKGFKYNIGSTFVHGKDQPLATFHFKYRSRSALQAMLLIPRTPSPEQRSEEDMTAQELRDLVRNLRVGLKTARVTPASYLFPGTRCFCRSQHQEGGDSTFICEAKA
ncbi:hypothetical protein K491DRAFT_98202 [Lophiostoma macrostomum CBS 122681]|uniref:DUF7918 domain-containing protein n=1 Tax=Lophiostoma macrostomum CBS 122681 TaxID=1314788 RepID=A0A6A6SU96_9PLEO|nr:hypothetical protein K491DRAFT_98202 [Lophiostoma macrostomum CBS 122681]